MTSSEPDPEGQTTPANLDVLKLQLERARYRTDLLKWIVIAIGAIVSFAVIDVGKLKLEQFRVASDSQRQLLDSYLKATESPQPDVWKRKLHVLEKFADDDGVRKWAQEELRYIEDFSARDALYRETLRVASQLIEPDRLKDPERIRARVRYNQLYWADLPYAGESQEVIQAMIDFRNHLMAAERASTNSDLWESLNGRLLTLSKALQDSTPKYPPQPTPQSSTGGNIEPMKQGILAFSFHRNTGMPYPATARVATLRNQKIAMDASTAFASMTRDSATHSGVSAGSRLINRSGFANACPHVYPQAQAHWKLSQPSQPVTSTTSPMKYRPGCFDSVVCCDSPRVPTPPAVTSAFL